MLPHHITSQSLQHFFLWPWQMVLPRHPSEFIASLSFCIFPFPSYIRQKWCSLSRSCSCYFLYLSLVIQCHKVISCLWLVHKAVSIFHLPPFWTKYFSALKYARILLLKCQSSLSSFFIFPLKTFCWEIWDKPGLVGVLQLCLSPMHCLPVNTCSSACM